MINFTQGDRAILDLTATDGGGLPVDLSSAVFTTYFRGPQGVAISFPNSQHTVNPDQILFRGKYTLDLSTADTASIPAGDNKEIISKIVIGASTIYYHGKNICNVLEPIPQQ